MLLVNMPAKPAHLSRQFSSEQDGVTEADWWVAGDPRQLVPGARHPPWGRTEAMQRGETRYLTGRLHRRACSAASLGGSCLSQVIASPALRTVTPGGVSVLCSGGVATAYRGVLLWLFCSGCSYAALLRWAVQDRA